MTLSVAAAIDLVLAHAGRQPVVESTLTEACGRVLAEAPIADRDSPPFAKSLMDGYAVRNADLVAGRADLLVLGTIFAGGAAERPLEEGTAYRIMTGAPLPVGAESVVMVERSTGKGGRVALDDPGFRAGQNVMQRGRELSAGQVVLEPGHRLGPASIGLLATIGCVRPRIYSRPRMSILATGDEIVAPEATPQGSQIRNSNGATLLGLAREADVEAISLGIVRDDRAELARRIREGLSADVLVLTGGVSVGAADFTPVVLEELGVQQIFHKVTFKPGAPIWFGTHASGLVFGLPGNPVSVLVCFKLFVETALRARQGRLQPRPQMIPARLKEETNYPTTRPTYHPAKLSSSAEGLVVEILPWFGSPDLCSLASANCLLTLPVADRPHPAGAWMHVLPLSGLEWESA